MDYDNYKKNLNLTRLDERWDDISPEDQLEIIQTSLRKLSYISQCFKAEETIDTKALRESGLDTYTFIPKKEVIDFYSIESLTRYRIAEDNSSIEFKLEQPYDDTNVRIKYTYVGSYLEGDGSDTAIRLHGSDLELFELIVLSEMFRFLKDRKKEWDYLQRIKEQMRFVNTIPEDTKPKSLGNFI